MANNNGSTPKPLEERVEYKELLSILAQDKVLEKEFVAALKGDDPEHFRMNGSEARRVLGWMLEQDPEKKQHLFDKIMDTIVKIPSTVEGWAEVREEAAKEIEEISKRQADCLKQRQKVESELQALRSLLDMKREDGTPMIKESDRESYDKSIETLEQRLKGYDRKMEILTAQVTAMTLMDAHAKTHEAQLESKARIEEMAPTRQSLKEWWVERTSQYKTMHQNIKQAKELSHFKRSEVKVQREILKDARNHAKKSNKIQAKIDKQEQEIIKKAQKIAMKDFRKSKGILGLKALARGERMAPPVIDTIDRATRYIADSERAMDDGRLQSMLYNLSKLESVQSMHDQATASALGILDKTFEERRQAIIGLAQQVEQQLENGEIGEGGLNALNKALEKGLEAASIDLDDVYFTDELRDFMKANGFEHMMRGADRSDIDGPAVDGPDFDGPDFGDR